MTLTTEAETRLLHLLRMATTEAAGLRFTGALGTCRGSTPILEPADEPQNEERTCVCGAITFFVAAEHTEIFNAAVLDYDNAFFGRGLSLTWTHHEGCDCAREKR